MDDHYGEEGMADLAAHAAVIASDVFQAEGWTWGLGESAYTPDTAQIEEHILGLAHRLMQYDVTSCESGRLVVTRDRTETGVTEAINVHLALGSYFFTP